MIGRKILICYLFLTIASGSLRTFILTKNNNKYYVFNKKNNKDISIYGIIYHYCGIGISPGSVGPSGTY